MPQWLGIDEIHIIKPRCVITNIEQQTIVDMLDNRNKATVTRYLSKRKDRDQVRYEQDAALRCCRGWPSDQLQLGHIHNTGSRDRGRAFIALFQPLNPDTH